MELFIDEEDVSMRKLVLPLAFVLAFALCACGSESSVVKDIPVKSDYIQYDYDALKATSEIIIKVVAQDGLSEKNSIPLSVQTMGRYALPSLQKWKNSMTETMRSPSKLLLNMKAI